MRRGRNRKFGHREPNGQRLRNVQIADRGPVIPPEVIAKRAELVGVKFTGDSIHDAKLSASLAADSAMGSAAGILMRRGILTQTQHAAAVRMGDLWRQWASMTAAPPRQALQRSQWGRAEEPTSEEWRRVKARMHAAMVSVDASHSAKALAWSMVESICADEVAPPRLLGDWPFGVQVVQSAMSALAVVFGIVKKPVDKQNAHVRNIGCM